MNLAGHRDRRLSENYFEPCLHVFLVIQISLLIVECLRKYCKQHK